MMPTINARKHVVPSGSDATVSRGAIFEAFGNSIRDVVPVANATERALLVAELSNAGQGPSADRPLVVYRADARGLHRIEYTTDGVTWVPASGVLDFPSMTAADSWAVTNRALLLPRDKARIADTVHVWDGGGWVPDRVINHRFERTVGSDAPVNAGTYIGLVEGTIRWAAAGQYLVTARASLYSLGGNVVGRVYAETQSGTAGPVREEARWDLPDVGAHPVSATVSRFFTHPGGDLRIAVGYRRDSGTFVVTGQGSGLTVVTAMYLGPGV